MTTAELQARQLHPLFVGELNGTDLRVLDDAALDGVRALMDRYGVLVVRNQEITDDEQAAFARRLGGQLVTTVGLRVINPAARSGDPALTDISNLDENGEIMSREDRRRMYALGNRLWHSDSSFQNPPARYSMLSAKEVPSSGGETEYADMRAAYDDLGERTKRQIAGLRAHHSVSHSRATIGFMFTEEQRAAFPGAEHPLVRTLPSGRTSLYIGAHASHVLGAPVPEGRVLLYDLMWHATQSRFVYTHAWRAGDLVIWDNRATMHRGRPYDELNELRDMRRVTTLDVDAVASAVA